MLTQLSAWAVAEDSLALVPVEERPFNAETPMEVLVEPMTPTNLFYVRNHFDIPRINAEAWRLIIDGEVRRSIELSLKDLQRLPDKTMIVTMECAGNGRLRMVPLPSGTPWAYGAVSTARFTGTPLEVVLDQAGVGPEAVEAAFVGADQGEVEPGRVEPFGRSLPLEVARHPDTLLVWAMNGEPLPPEHGSPLRLVVPRWYGVASVKWLLRISLLSRPFDGYFQRERYVYVGERGTPDGMPVSLTRMRSVIGWPTDGEKVPLRPVLVAGTAWSGAGEINRVEVSIDNGLSWTEAQLGTAISPYAAMPWRFLWNPPRPGAYTLMARASDRAGNTQPLDPVWNAYGYGNNVVHRVRVTILEG